MKCPICKSDLMQGVSKARRVLQGKKVFYLNIPAYVCTNGVTCETVMFDSVQLEEIDNFEERVKSGVVEQKDVYDYTEIK